MKNNIDYRKYFENELLMELDTFKTSVISKDQVLLNSGSYIKVVPIVLSGRIKVVKRNNENHEILLYYIEKNESCILSITSALNNEKSRVDAIAEKDTEFIILPTAIIKEWMNKYNGWRKFLMKLYNERLTELLSIVDEVAFKNMDFRLIEKLKEKSGKNNEIQITHQHLANEMGTAREVVSRLLKKLEKDGKVKLSRGKIIIIGAL